MSNSNHKDVFINNIDKSIILYIKNGNSRVKIPIDPGKSADLLDFRGKKNICFIVESPLVPSKSQNNIVGLRLILPENVNPDSIEVLSIPENKIKLIACFKNGFPKGAIELANHIDPSVHHPEGDT